LPFLVGDKSSKDCVLQKDGKFVECVSFQKVLAIFPDDIDTSKDNDLNIFGEKFIYLYGHFIAVLNAKDAECVDGKSKPSTYAFEKEILYSQITTPCNHHREICSIRAYEEEILKPRGIEFTPDPRVSAKMGRKLKDNCIVLTPTLKSGADEIFYICSEKFDVLHEIKWQLNRILFKFDPEKHNSVKMLSEDKSATADVYIHIADNMLKVDENPP